LLDGATFQSLDREYEIIACALGSARDCNVAGVLAFPRRSEWPFASGFSGGRTLEAALRGAERECLQTLAFLWGEAIPTAPPPVSADPSYHQEYYLYPGHHAALRAWLAGTHVERRCTLVATRGANGYVDLTPAHLRGRLRVAKALPHHELPLAFGFGHPSVVGSLAPELAVHPIA
jgi:hypothetical protein